MLAFRSNDRATLGFFTPWRLSGLLSGYLPTDTRPQARAKLGKTGNRFFGPGVQQLFWAADNFLQRAFAALQQGRSERVQHERMLSLVKAWRDDLPVHRLLHVIARSERRGNPEPQAKEDLIDWFSKFEFAASQLRLRGGR